MSKEGCFRFEDFLVGSPIGQGAFGQIYIATEIKSNNQYALKALNRRFLIKMKKQSQAVIEKEALTKCDCPFVIKLHGTFKDASSLYFVLEYAEHGDLAEAVTDLGSLNTEATIVVCAQILTAISVIHSHNIIHRDLKLENILLDAHNNIKITDFGTAMICENPGHELRRSSIVGTPMFVAPELLNDGQISFSSDIWAFGCCIFNLLTGNAPFEGESTPELMSNIVAGKIKSNIAELPSTAQDLIRKILVVDPTKRLGYGEESSGYPSIKNHPFFHQVDWDNISSMKMPMFSSFTPDTPTSFVREYLDPGETVIVDGIVDRKRFFSWKPRVLILTSKKRFMVFNLDNHKIKENFTVSLKNKVEVGKDGKEWSITLPNGNVQQFRCKDCTAGLWASSIMKVSI